MSGPALFQALEVQTEPDREGPVSREIMPSLNPFPVPDEPLHSLLKALSQTQKDKYHVNSLICGN